MIQFNLLPDVKLQFIKTRYRKRIVIAASVLVSGLFLVIFIALLLFVRVQQKLEIKSIDDDITKSEKALRAIPDLDKILTIQNQLASLPGLHDKKVITSRLFDYITQFTPAQATMSSVTADFEANKITIIGNADNLVTVNKFVDTLKFTTYKTAEDQPREGKAFSAVVLTNYSVGGAAGAAQGVSYGIDFTFDPVLFTNITAAKDSTVPALTLVVPAITSTRSTTEKPIFVPQAKDEEEKN